MSVAAESDGTTDGRDGRVCFDDSDFGARAKFRAFADDKHTGNEGTGLTSTRRAVIRTISISTANATSGSKDSVTRSMPSKIVSESGRSNTRELKTSRHGFLCELPSTDIVEAASAGPSSGGDPPDPPADVVADSEATAVPIMIQFPFLFPLLRPV
jgi:hypothetical protein